MPALGVEIRIAFDFSLMPITHRCFVMVTKRGHEATRLNRDFINEFTNQDTSAQRKRVFKWCVSTYQKAPNKLGG
jgi:hypothetical protein